MVGDFWGGGSGKGVGGGSGREGGRGRGWGWGGMDEGNGRTGQKAFIRKGAWRLYRITFPNCINFLC